MGWSDEQQEPPLTEEEVLSAKRDIETHRDRIETKKKAQSPTILSPFPWVCLYNPCTGSLIKSNNKKLF